MHHLGQLQRFKMCIYIYIIYIVGCVSYHIPFSPGDGWFQYPAQNTKKKEPSFLKLVTALVTQTTSHPDSTKNGWHMVVYPHVCWLNPHYIQNAQ